MKSILMMAWANIKKKKGESFLIALSVFVAVTTLGVALGLFTGLHKPFDTMMTRTQSPHILIFFDTGLHQTEALEAWFQAQPEVVHTKTSVPVFHSSSSTVSGERELKKSLLLSEVPSQVSQGNHFKLLSWAGEQPPTQPQLEEIWIPKQMAHSLKLKLGDVIGVPTRSGRRDLTISGLVLDPYFSTSNITPTRCWIAPGSLPTLISMGEMNDRCLPILLENPSDASEVEKRFRAHLGGNFAGWTMNYNIAKMAYSIFLNMLSVALLVVAIMALIIALSMMSATMTSAIYAQFKQIGVLKAGGFTPKGINAIYMIQYLILGLIAIPPGLVFGFWICRSIFQKVTLSIGLLEVPFTWIIPVLLPFFIVSSILAFGAWWTSRKAGRIQPMQAIRFGMPQAKVKPPSKISRFLLPLIPAKLFLAWRNLSLNPKRTFFAGLGLSMTIFVMVFSVNIIKTFGTLAENTALFGQTNADVNVSLTSKRFTIKDDSFLNLMAAEPGIAAILPSRSVRGMTAQPGDGQGKTIFGRAFDGDMKSLGLMNLEGRNPTEPHEIALGVNTAKQANIELGDTYALFLEGQTLEFEVTGIYQTANNFGEGFRIRADRLKELLPKYRAGLFDIALHPDQDPETFKQDLKQRFSEAVAISTKKDDQAEINRIMGGMQITLLLLSLVLLAVSCVMLINDTLLSLVEHKKMFGILKTVGMTPRGLRTALAFKATFIALVSLILALPFALIVIPKMLSLVASGIGLVQFPMAVNVSGIALLVPCVLGFAFFSTWLASKPVTRIEPRQLICE